MRPATAKRSAPITPCENICSTAPETPRTFAVAKPKKHETHVAHARIADDEFQVALSQGDRCGINNSDHGQNRDPFSPHLKTLREKIHRDAQRAIGSEFHHDSGEQHRTRSRRSHVAGRRPGVQWPDAGKNGKTEEQNRERPGLKLRGKLESARVRFKSSEPAVT